MISTVTFLDMNDSLVMYEVIRCKEDPDTWTMVKLEIGKAEAATESIPGEVIHRGSKDEILRLARILMATTRDVNCEGCQCPLDKCGPPSWILGRKCCPDCNHSQG